MHAHTQSPQRERETETERSMRGKTEREHAQNLTVP